MAITVTRADLKAWIGLTSTTWDAAIDDLIDRWTDWLGYAVDDGFLGSSDAGLAATLDLGALEAVAGEAVAMLVRSPGGGEVVSVEGLVLSPRWSGAAADPSGQKSQGLARLRPFFHTDAELVGGGVMASPLEEPEL